MSKMFWILILTLLTTMVNGERCGLSNKSFRIIGGSETSPLQYPWMVLMILHWNSVKPGNVILTKCGASLIDDRWALTAAHCFNEPDESKGLISVKLIVGEHNTEDTHNAHRIILNAIELHIHNNYKNETKENDIAIVKLNHQLDFNGKHHYLQPICLPIKGLPVRGNECFASGWGKTLINGSESHVLRHVNLPLINQDECLKIWGKIITTNKFCAGILSGGKDTCQGDSGGPLQCPLENRVWVLYGITSFGGLCGAKGFPGVYTHVENYINWINAIRTGTGMTGK